MKDVNKYFFEEHVDTLLETPIDKWYSYMNTLQAKSLLADADSIQGCLDAI